MTAIVLGAFLRGPLIIFVHMVKWNYTGSRFQVPGSGFKVLVRGSGTWNLSILDGMSRRRVAGFGYRSKQRRGVFPNHVVRVRREVPCVVRDVERIASD